MFRRAIYVLVELIIYVIRVLVDANEDNDDSVKLFDLWDLNR